jgi:hypothetical protein
MCPSRDDEDPDTVTIHGTAQTVALICVLGAMFAAWCFAIVNGVALARADVRWRKDLASRGECDFHWIAYTFRDLPLGHYRRVLGNRARSGAGLSDLERDMRKRFVRVAWAFLAFMASALLALGIPLL